MHQKKTAIRHEVIIIFINIGILFKINYFNH
jgi:hypothetical protein